MLSGREFPLVRPPRTGGQNLVEEAAERVEQYRRMILLGELLGFVRNKEDWTAVLDFGKRGFQGDPPLLSKLRALSERVAAGGTVENVTAAGLLAQRSATSDAMVARLITQGSREVAGTVKSVVIWKKRLELFGLALEGDKLSEQQKIIIRGYPAEDFLRLLALGDKNVDEMGVEPSPRWNSSGLVSSNLHLRNLPRVLGRWRGWKTGFPETTTTRMVTAPH